MNGAKGTDPSTPLRDPQDDIPVVRCIIRPLNNHLSRQGKSAGGYCTKMHCEIGGIVIKSSKKNAMRGYP